MTITDKKRDVSPLVYTKKDCLLYSLGVLDDRAHALYEGHYLFESVQPHTSMILSMLFKGGDSADIVHFPGPHLANVIPEIPCKGAILDAGRQLILHKKLPSSVSVSDNIFMISELSSLTVKKGKGILCEIITRITRERDSDISHETCHSINENDYATIVTRLFFIKPLDEESISEFGIPIDLGVCSHKRSPEITEHITETFTVHIPRFQAALFRLSGDYNSLHIDNGIPPSRDLDNKCDLKYNKALNKYILHGLCTLGISISKIHNESILFLKSDKNNNEFHVTGIECRFLKPVSPGSNIKIDILETFTQKDVTKEGSDEGNVKEYSVVYRVSTLRITSDVSGVSSENTDVILEGCVRFSALEQQINDSF